MQDAAPRAHPRTGAKGKRHEQMPARGARLRRRVPAVHDGQLAPVPFRFVGEERAELRPPGAADRLRQRPVADHVADGEVLDGDAVEPAHLPGVPVGEGPVPHHADAAERTRQYRCLFGVGVGPDLIRRPHTASLLHGSDVSKRTLRPCSPIHPRPERRGLSPEDHGKPSAADPNWPVGPEQGQRPHAW